MSLNLLQRRFAWSHWANLHVIELLTQVPDADFRADNTRFYSGSAWSNLRHLLDVDWSWMRCCQGLDIKPYLWDLHPFDTLAEMQAFLAEEYPRVLAYVASLDEAALAEPIDRSNPAAGVEKWVTRGDLLAHILNHGTEHRSDLAHFLTDHSLSPGDLDYLDWLPRVGETGGR